MKLMSQINAAFPGRDTSSDGSIGDAAHASRSSDHNPWVIDRNGQPVVTAQDIDEDLSSSIHSIQKVVDAICASRDKRVKYIIYEGKITVAGTQLQQWKKYTGKNSHSHHCHISVFPDQKLYDDDSPWAIGIAKAAAPEPVLDIPQIQKPRHEPAAAPAQAGNAQSVTEVAAADPLANGGASSTEQLPATQNAEQITNITAGDKTVPDNFVPEDKEVAAPPKEDSTKNAAKVTVLGFAVPAFLAGIVTAIKSAFEQGYVDAREVFTVILSFISNNQKFVFIGLVLLIVGMMLKKLYKQITLWIQMYIAARADMHNVSVKPQ